jgi:hypothetical protein
MALHWWGVNSILPDRHQLDEFSEPLSAPEEAFEASEAKYANPRGYTCQLWEIERAARRSPQVRIA